MGNKQKWIFVILGIFFGFPVALIMLMVQIATSVILSPLLLMTFLVTVFVYHKKDNKTQKKHFTYAAASSAIMVLVLSLTQGINTSDEAVRQRDINVAMKMNEYHLFDEIIDETEDQMTKEEQLTEEVEILEEEAPDEVETAEELEKPEDIGEVIIEEPEETEEQTEDDETSKFENIFVEKGQNVFGDRLINVDVYGDSSDRVNLKIELKDSWTKKSVRWGVLRDMETYLEEIQNEDYGEVYLGFHTDLINVYGEVYNQEVAYGKFTKETVDRINFENFITENISSIAEYLEYDNVLKDN